MLPHWDYNSDLQLARTVKVDEAGLREDCGLSSEAQLELVTVWHSSGTSLRGCGDRLTIGASRHNTAHVLNLSIPGTMLAVEVSIGTQIVLAHRGSHADSIAARLPGTILWEDLVTVALEGTASRFPMEVVEFDSSTWLPYRAGWFLAWNRHELQLPFLKNVRLFLNAAHVPVVVAIQSLNPSPQQAAIQSAIFCDVGRQLIRGALDNDEFIENPEAFSHGSTGHAVLGIIRTYMPGEDPHELLSTMRSRPEFFDAMLQGAFNIFASLE